MTAENRLDGRVGVFIHIPKTAGLSIDRALGLTKYRWRQKLVPGQQYSGLVTFGHEFLPWLQARKLVPRDNLFTFAFCRNPYDRAVSLWAYNNKRNDMELTFREFCLNWGNWGWRVRTPQSKWLDGVDLGFLGRFENLQEDFGKLCDMLDMERRRLPHVNPTQHGPCRDYYDEVTQGIVRALYARDFERFGYAVDHLPD